VFIKKTGVFMGAKYSVQAATAREYRVKSVIICAVLMVLALTAFGLTVYNIIKLNFLYVLGYLIGIALALAVVLMRLNITFATRISADRNTLVLTGWDNMLVPYQTDFSVKFLREFVPAKTRSIKVPIEEITDIYIGTKSYISRSADETFGEVMSQLIPAADMKKIAKSDLFAVRTRRTFHVMSIDNFDTREVGKLVSNILRANEAAELHTSSKKYRVYLKR